MFIIGNHNIFFVPSEKATNLLLFQFEMKMFMQLVCLGQEKKLFKELNRKENKNFQPILKFLRIHFRSERLLYYLVWPQLKLGDNLASFTVK